MFNPKRIKRITLLITKGEILLEPRANLPSVINNSSVNRHTILIITAFAALYLIWGSTYLGIKYAIETLPTFIMTGTRFLVAGAVLFIVARVSSDYEKPKLVHWR